MDEDLTSAESSISECDTEPDEASELDEASDDQHYGAAEKQRREQACKNYFEGQSRKPYRLRKRLRNSMDGNEVVLDGVCKQCSPAFSKIVEGFRKLVHQGSELKRKKSYPDRGQDTLP